MNGCGMVLLDGEFSDFDRGGEYLQWLCVKRLGRWWNPLAGFAKVIYIVGISVFEYYE